MQYSKTGPLDTTTLNESVCCSIIDYVYYILILLLLSQLEDGIMWREG